MPTCSKCKAAGSPCTAFNPKGDTEIPRSVVHFLEHEIATLETQLNRDGLIKGSESPEIFMGREENDHARIAAVPAFVESRGSLEEPPRKDSMKEAILASNDLQLMIGATMPSGTCLTDMLSNVRMGLTPSYTPSSPAEAATSPIQSSVNIRQNDEDIVEIPIFSSLPSHVIHTLVKKFIQRVLPIYPFLYEPSIWGHVERAMQKSPPALSGLTTISSWCISFWRFHQLWEAPTVAMKHVVWPFPGLCFQRASTICQAKHHSQMI